jgi:hypothetical protein
VAQLAENPGALALGGYDKRRLHGV